MKPIIETENLTKFYGRAIGIQDVNLVVEEGELFGFLGPNGAGKTTTIRILLDLIRPTRGAYRIFGLDKSAHARGIRPHIGNLPGEIGFYGNMSGQQFLDYLARFQPAHPPILQQQLCAQFDLDRFALNKKIKYYSKGMKQKLGLIQAMQHDPELLILDEPSEGLDPLRQQTLYETLLDFKRRGRTVLFSSHILPEVEKICDRVAIIRDGIIQTIETIPNLKQKYHRKMAIAAPQAVIQTIKTWPNLTFESMTGATAMFRLNCPAASLLPGLASLTIDEIILPEPELEDVFLQFYRPLHKM